MDTPELLAHLADRLGKHQVLGEPYEGDGVTVIPVARVRSGGGFGGRGRRGQQDNDGDGGGLGMDSRPVGAWVIKGQDVSWQPAIDVNRVIVGGQLLVFAALLVLRGVLRRKGAAADR